MPDGWESFMSEVRNLALTCSNCGTLVAISPDVVEGQTFTATRDRMDYEDRRYSVLIPSQWDTPGYLVSTCSRCSTRLIVEVPHVDPPTVVWPLANTRVPKEVPEPVRAAVVDAKRAAAAKSVTGAVMSLRTAVERIQRDRGAESLTALWDDTRLPPDLFDTANEPRLWGHVMAHDDFDPDAIKEEHVAELVTFVDMLLDLLYVVPERLRRARETRKAIEPPSTTDEG